MSKPKIERKINVPLELIKELLTPSEWRMVKQRLHIITLVNDGLSIRQVASQAKVGTDTVVRIFRKYQASSILKNYVKKTNVSPSSKWVFGKSEE